MDDVGPGVESQGIEGQSRAQLRYALPCPIASDYVCPVEDLDLGDNRLLGIQAI